MTHEKSSSQPQTGRKVNDRHGNVPDGATQEGERAHQQAVQNAPDGKKRQLNEGGRTNDSSQQHNPPGSTHGLPTPNSTPGT